VGRTLFLLVSVIALWMAGCATSHFGQKIESSQVNTIQKGVTTRAEIERTFGAPINTALLPDGRRAMHFSYNESRLKGGTFVPFGLGGGGADTRRQSLQVIIGSDNIVQDYEFSDTTGETKTGAFGASHTYTNQPTTSK
jgi:hypothetical protein